MPVTSLDSGSFGRVLGRPGLLLIEWGAKWCVPFLSGAGLEQLASRHRDLTVASVDVNAQQELVEVLGVQALPTLMLFRDGHLLLNHVGALPEPHLEELVRRARALDMATIRQPRGGPWTRASRMRVSLHRV